MTDDIYQEIAITSTRVHDEFNRIMGSKDWGEKDIRKSSELAGMQKILLWLLIRKKGENFEIN